MRMEWTDELITEKILEVIHKEKLTHFPTHNEIRAYYQDEALNNALSRRGGTEYWAKKLGLPLKKSKSSTGLFYEAMAVEDILKYTGLKSTMMTPGYAYDLFVDDSVKVDVKASHPTIHKKNTDLYTFALEKRFPTCDFFIAYCINNDEEVVKTFVIPSSRLSGMIQLTIGEDSKYNIFRNRWDYITRYNAYCKTMAKRT